MRSFPKEFEAALEQDKIAFPEVLLKNKSDRDRYLTMTNKQ